MFEKIKLKLFGRRSVKGDTAPVDTELLKKRYEGGWSIPSQYQGEEIICSICNKTFIFSAQQKKQYYEGGGNIYAKIHMCPECYRKSRA